MPHPAFESRDGGELLLRARLLCTIGDEGESRAMSWPVGEDVSDPALTRRIVAHSQSVVIKNLRLLHLAFGVRGQRGDRVEPVVQHPYLDNWTSSSKSRPTSTQCLDKAVAACFWFRPSRFCDTVQSTFHHFYGN